MSALNTWPWPSSTHCGANAQAARTPMTGSGRGTEFSFLVNHVVMLPFPSVKVAVPDSCCDSFM